MSQEAGNTRKQKTAATTAAATTNITATQKLQQQQKFQQQQQQNGQQQQQQMGPSKTLLSGFKGVSSMIFVDDAGKDILRNLHILTRAVSLLLDAVVKNLKQLHIPCNIVEKRTPENLAAFVDTLTKLFEINDDILEGSTYTGNERNGVLDAGETQLNHTEVDMADSENINDINAESTAGNMEGQEDLSECTNEFIKEIDVLDVISGGETAPIVLDSGKGVDLDFNTGNETQTEKLPENIKKSVEHLIFNLECPARPDTEARNDIGLAKDQNDIVRESDEKVTLVISIEDENSLSPDESPVVCKKQKLFEGTRTAGIRSSKFVVKRYCHACRDSYTQWNEHLQTSEHKSAMIRRKVRCVTD